MHNWEVVVNFEVHGQGKHLFGDGFAFWYTREKGQIGPVFGSRDFFTGLGVFFDTYSNHNGEHKVINRQPLTTVPCLRDEINTIFIAAACLFTGKRGFPL